MTEIKRVVCDNVKKFFIMLIGSLILYYSFFVEKLANPDAICTGFSYKAEYFWENALGRVGLQVIGAIKGYNILPYLSTFFALVFLCIRRYDFELISGTSLSSIKSYGKHFLISIFSLSTNQNVVTHHKLSLFTQLLMNMFMGK